MEFSVKPVAKIRTDFDEKFGIPRQSGRVKTYGKIVFEPEYRDEAAIKEIDGFDYLWLIFDFSEAHREKWSPTVRPPRLGGNRKVGVFASRSPFRPNHLGLSSVKLVGTERTEKDGTVLIVEGADLMDGTPILDIKPYLRTDCHPDAKCGYADETNDHFVKVVFPEELKKLLPCDKAEELEGCLREDPRPAYIDEERSYGVKFCGKNVKFTIKNDVLTVTDIE